MTCRRVSHENHLFFNERTEMKVLEIHKYIDFEQKERVHSMIIILKIEKKQTLKTRSEKQYLSPVSMDIYILKENTSRNKLNNPKIDMLYLQRRCPYW